MLSRISSWRFGRGLWSVSVIAHGLIKKPRGFLFELARSLLHVCPAISKSLVVSNDKKCYANNAIEVEANKLRESGLP